MLLLLLACKPPADATLTVGAPIQTVPERFLSFALDTAQVGGGVFWNPDPDGEPEIEVDPIDLSSPRLRALTAPLTPATLRIGGTAADFAWYQLPGTGPAPAAYALTVDEDEVDGVLDFASDLDLELLWTVNAGPGPRTSGAWDPANTQALLRHLEQRDAPLAILELGNEINAYPLMHGFTLGPEAYAADLRTLASTRDELFPGVGLAGPSSAYWPSAGEFVPYTEDAVPAAADVLDVITWHYYPQQSERCPVQTVPATPETMLDPANLDEVATWAASVEQVREQAGSDAAIWLGETGNAQCGGAPGVSDRFAGGFWWLDQLGQLAARGHQGVVRQTLTGSDYGLLTPELEPTADWWTSVLYQWLVGTTVLEASADHEALRVYAHCSNQQGVVALVINPTDQALTLDVGGRAESWMLTAESLESAEVLLEGEPLVLDEDASLPPLVPTSRRHGVVDIPALSYGLVRVTELDQHCPQVNIERE